MSISLDIFFSPDTSSTTRILPLVHPSNLQITSRGRVVFNIMPSSRMSSLNDVTSYISFLPPEYLNSLGKKITFIESDIEKVLLPIKFIIYTYVCVSQYRLSSSSKAINIQQYYFKSLGFH